MSRNKVKLYSHPPYSPDVNPIENVWSLLKDRLSKRPFGSLGLGNNKESINSFIKAIKEEWQALSQQDIDNYILSLPRRYNAVVEAKG